MPQTVRLFSGVIVLNSDQLLNSDEPSSEANTATKERTNYSHYSEFWRRTASFHPHFVLDVFKEKH